MVEKSANYTLLYMFLVAESSMIAGVNMVATKKDVISFVNNSSATELHVFCNFINDYQERKKPKQNFSSR